MKVYIGPYRDWIGPYQVGRSLRRVIGEKYAEKLVDSEWFAKFVHITTPAFEWIHKFKKRKVKIKIHNYDTWSADHTLSLIIVPLLERLHGSKAGSAYVDDEDVPEFLRSGDDSLVHQRWDWVLREMIWAFTEHRNEDEPKETYPFMYGYDDVTAVLSEITGIDYAASVDDAELQMLLSDYEEMYYERVRNGFRLFGKYYTALWS